MTTPRDFRVFAMDCLRWAADAPDASQQQTLFDIAKLFMRRSLEMDELVLLGESPLVDDLEAGLAKRPHAMSLAAASRHPMSFDVFNDGATTREQSAS
jgi:hypothetical protein